MPDDPKKDGLQAAIDTTKYTLAVSGAAIGFLLGSDTAKNITTAFTRWTVTLALICFGVSAIGGVLVLLQGASNISNAAYDLSQPQIKYPGMVNILGAALGFLFATLFVISYIWTLDP